MKPRIKVIQIGCKFEYEYELDASPPEVDFVAHQFVNGIAKKELEKELQELTKFPTVHFPKLQAMAQFAFLVVIIIASLAWAIYEVSELWT